MNLSDRWDLTPTACCDQEMWCTCRNLLTGLVLLSGMRYRTPLASGSPLHHPLSFSLKYVEQMIELLLFCHRLSMEFYWETLKNLNEQTKFPFNDTDLKKNLNINKNILTDWLNLGFWDYWRKLSLFFALKLSRLLHTNNTLRELLFRFLGRNESSSSVEMRILRTRCESDQLVKSFSYFSPLWTDAGGRLVRTIIVLPHTTSEASSALGSSARKNAKRMRSPIPIQMLGYTISLFGIYSCILYCWSWFKWPGY